jgi:hypothetical protein
MTLETLNPVRDVRLGTETIQVKELCWREALEFLQRLATSVACVLNEQGKFVPTAQAFEQLVVGSAELTELLLTRATGRDRDWLAQRSVAEVFALLDVALELNLSEDLITRGKRLAERVRGAFGSSNSAP